MLFAVPHHECDMYGLACKLYMLLHTKQIFVDSHINCLVTKKQCFMHVTSYHDGLTVFLSYFREHVGGFWVDVTHYNFSHLKYLETGLWLAFLEKKKFDFQEQITDIKWETPVQK